MRSKLPGRGLRGPLRRANQAEWEQVGPDTALYQSTPFRTARSYVPTEFAMAGRTTDLAIDPNCGLASGLGRSRSDSAGCGSLPQAAESGAPRTRSLRTRSGGTWAGASGSTRPGRSRSTRTIRARTRSGSARARATRAGAAVSQASGSTRRPTAATTGPARTAPRRSTPAVSARSGSSRATRTRSTRAPRLPCAGTRPCAATAASPSTGR